MKGNILYVITGLSMGGAEKLLSESAPLIKKDGYNVDVLSICRCETELTCKIRELGINLIKSYPFQVYNPIHIIKICRLFKGYDLVHVHLFPALYWVVIAKVITGSRIKLVYTEHSTSNRRRRNRIFRFLDYWIYRNYSRIITISEEVDQSLKKHLKLLPNEKFVLIENGINLVDIDRALPLPPKVFFSDDHQKLVLQVSSFRWQKDQITLIKAVSILPSFVKLLLVGEGPLKRRCEEYVQELGIGSRVCFLGIRSDIPQLLKTADLIVLSSIYEGLSLASIEGMASGRPFIASDVPGLTKIVKGAGILFTKGDFQKLSEYIIQLLTDKKYYDQVARQCWKKSREFDINKMIANYSDLYIQLLNEPSCSNTTEIRGII